MSNTYFSLYIMTKRTLKVGNTSAVLTANIQKDFHKNSIVNMEETKLDADEKK